LTFDTLDILYHLMYSQQFLRKWVEMFDIVEQFKVLKSYLKNLCVMLSVYFVQRCIMYID